MNLGEYTKNTHWTKVDWLEGAGTDTGSPIVFKIFLLRVGWGTYLGSEEVGDLDGI